MLPLLALSARLRFTCDLLAMELPPEDVGPDIVMQKGAMVMHATRPLATPSRKPMRLPDLKCLISGYFLGLLFSQHIF